MTPLLTRRTAAVIVVYMAVCFSVVLPVDSDAGEYAYKCVITQVMDRKESGGGIKEPGDEKLVAKSTGEAGTGERFEVSRETGEITGSILGAGGTMGTKTQIFSQGSSHSPFTLLKNHNNGGVVELIYIVEYVEGDKKPFTAFSTYAGVLVGYCE